MLRLGQKNLLCLLAALSNIFATARAAEMTRSGATILVRGRIDVGDDLRFAAVAPQGSYSRVDLSSIGGSLSVAGSIARNIKATGATTVYDASRGPCSSSCTILFVAGARRHYVNSGGIQEGIGAQGKSGLGFHTARSYEAGGGGRSMATMTALYYEMGTPSAVDLSTKSPNRTAYYISGQTAVALNIATSLNRP